MNNSTKTNAAFISVTILFFAWGFIASNNDPLLTALKAIFNLSWSEALLTQFVAFIASGLISLPAAALINRIGALKTILTALAIMACGCFFVDIGTELQVYGFILAALFVLAAGITSLQVAANPLIAGLGPQETSHFRLTFAQTFNSLGVVIGVHYGSKIMLSSDILAVKKDLLTGAITPISDPIQRAAALGAVSHAFFLMGLAVLGLMAFVYWQRKLIIQQNQSQTSQANISVLEALKSKWAVFGALVIGLYVGAEVSIGSIMIRFLNQSNILDLKLEIAGNYLANIYWGGALIGRFIGSYLLTKIRAANLLFLAAAFAAILCLTAAISEGPVAGYAALGVGFFNSIMFPTIFTITLEKSEAAQSSTSGLLCLAISFGAILPLLMGAIADNSTLSMSFFVPVFAYIIISIFAAIAKKGPLGLSPRA